MFALSIHREVKTTKLWPVKYLWDGCISTQSVRTAWQFPLYGWRQTISIRKVKLQHMWLFKITHDMNDWVIGAGWRTFYLVVKEIVVTVGGLFHYIVLHNSRIMLCYCSVIRFKFMNDTFVIWQFRVRNKYFIFHDRKLNKAYKTSSCKILGNLLFLTNLYLWNVLG